jgi:hypothetical protein
LNRCASANPNRRACKDIAQCRNTIGSFTCDCPSGTHKAYGPDGEFIRCDDVNECDRKKFSFCVPTTEGGVCTNTFGEFSCSCARGFTGSGYSDRDGCTDVNECNDNTHDCGTSQRCLNSFGSFFCECKERSSEAKQSECYARGFWQSNKPLLQAFGFQGEVRLVRQGKGGGANNSLSFTRCFWRSLLAAFPLVSRSRPRFHVFR